MFAQQLTAQNVTYRRYDRSLVVELGWRSDSGSLSNIHY